MSSITEVNAETGEATERPLTAEERTQREKDTAAAIARHKARTRRPTLTPSWRLR